MNLSYKRHCAWSDTTCIKIDKPPVVHIFSNIMYCYMTPIKDLLWLAETSLHWLWQILMSNSEELKTGNITDRELKIGWTRSSPGDIIQLMHSFEFNIRICQPENSDVHRGEAEVNITFEGWLILMLTEKECTNCFVIWHCLSFIFIFINLLKSDVLRKIISTIYFPNFCNSYEISKIIAF